MNCTKCGGNGFLLTKVRRKSIANADRKFKFKGNRKEVQVDVDEAVPCQVCKPGLYAAHMERRTDEFFRNRRKPDDIESRREKNRKKAEERFQ